MNSHVMKTYCFIGFSASLLALAGGGLATNASAQVELVPNTIQGTLRFNNANPAILDLLNAPNNEGMSNRYVYAYSGPPQNRIAASDYLPADSRTQSDYEITVDSDATGIEYAVWPRVSMLGQNQTYYFNGLTSAPVVAFMPGATLNFEECLGVMTVRFVDASGAPLAVDSGNIIANEISPYTEIGRVHAIASGATEQRIYLRGGVAVQLIVTVSRGTSTFTDRLQYLTQTNVMVACDDLASVNIAVPGTGALGEATGTVDMLGEFELAVDGYDAGDYTDYTGVSARFGPFSNIRYAAVPGVNFTTPSSGTFVLSNLVPSTLDPASRGYLVSAEMFIRTNTGLQYFRTPALGSGANPPLVVTPAASLNLSNLFVINPGYLRGRVSLHGPAESPGRESSLRGLDFASDYDADEDGIADGIGIYGVYYSMVGALGVDRPAPGANFTASYGYGYGGYKGEFDPATSAYEGRYELALGGLNGESTLWHPTYVNIAAYNNVVEDEEDYYYFGMTITETAPPDVQIDPGEVVTNDLAYCFSEVRIAFRSTEPFYSPSIRFSHGGFTNIDFQGKPANYSVYVDPVYGLPVYQMDASTSGVVVMYLPQGSYRLTPYITPAHSQSATVSGNPIEVTVGCGQRISIEECLRLELDRLPCAQPGPTIVSGSVRSCTNGVSLLTYELNGAEPVVACTDCGINPSFSLDLTLEPGTNTLKITATDELGRISSLQTPLVPDVLPPVITCPSNPTAEVSRPCGAVVQFAATAVDGCDPAPVIVCTPPSGSVFAPGETEVLCVATDAAGNAAQCSFTVTVTGEANDPLPTITGISPQLLGIAGGAQVTVIGTGFTIDDEVLLDGQSLLYPVLVSAEEMQGQAPVLPAGTHDVQIRRCGQIVARLIGACVSGTLPRIFTVDPRQAFARGGSLITVRGTNFLPTTRIRIAFPAPGGTENLLINPTVSADGTAIIGQVPPLPASELLGPRDVIAEEARGSDVLPSGLCYLPNPFETDPQVVSLRALQAASTIPVDATWRNGFPSGLTARVKVGGASPAERAMGFVRSFRELFRVQNPDGELTVKRVTQEGLDDVRLAQSYGGLPVFASEIVVTLSGEDVVALTGNLLPLAELEERGFDVVPQITREEAIELARLDENIQRPVAELEAIAELLIYDERLFTDAPLDPHLGWKVTMKFAAHDVVVDAHSGAIVARLAIERAHGFDLDIQDAEFEANSKQHKCYRTSTDTDVADEDDFNSDYNGNIDAVLANRYSRDCWNFFHDTFGWHSYDDDESQMEIFIQSNINAGNVASWDPGCELMQFAPGAVEYEVMVHEFTHGIISSTSQLEYKFESGALDEHYADTMAVIADRQRGEIDSETSGFSQPINWMIGENRRAPQPTFAIRNFQDPTTRPPRPGQPDRWANRSFPGVFIANEGNDYAGVHSNSGIPNKGGYLMVEGGSFQGFLVRGMGTDKMRHVKFSAMRNLPKAATFADARAREIVAADYFFSRNERGFTRDDVCTVRNAWAAVGIGMGDSDCDGIEDTRNDTDGDLIPNKIDNCPFFANPRQEDPDGDKLGGTETVDAAGNIIKVGCDNCPNAFNPGQEDYDGDNMGDVCDPDLDGDGCLNTVDQDPSSNQHQIGTLIPGPLCNVGSSALFGFAGGNTDLGRPNGDALLDCEDTDDDGDGIPDFGFDGIRGTADDDPCPIGPLNDLGSCTAIRDCPMIRDDWWRTCLGGGCVQFYAKFHERINPDPTQPVIIDQIRIVNQTLYLQPNAGTSLSSLAQKIAQVGPQAAGARNSRGVFTAAGQNPLWRVEIWAKATDTEPARLVAVVGDYDPSQITIGQLTSGSMLALSFEANNAPPTLDATWHTGADPATANQDSDNDGLPDGWEIQNGSHPRNPDDATLDADGDGANNFAEFLAGTNPRDASSVLRLLRVERQPQGLRVEFIATPGLSLQLEKTPGLGQPQWSSVGEAVRGQGGVAAVVDPNPSGAQAFYRLRLLVP